MKQWSSVAEQTLIRFPLPFIIKSNGSYHTYTHTHRHRHQFSIMRSPLVLLLLLLSPFLLLLAQAKPTPSLTTTTPSTPKPPTYNSTLAKTLADYCAAAYACGSFQGCRHWKCTSCLEHPNTEIIRFSGVNTSTSGFVSMCKCVCLCVCVGVCVH